MIPAVVLAAGRSSRMGRPKAALPLPGGGTFLSRLVTSLAGGGASPVVVVTGADAQAVREACDGAQVFVPVVFIHNRESERGQLSSLQRGISAVSADAGAALVALVDVPLVKPATVAALIDAWQQTSAPLVRPARHGRHGHPYVAGRPILEAITLAAFDVTAREVLRPWLPGLELGVADDEGPFEDVDTPEEYARLVERLSTKGAM